MEHDLGPKHAAEKAVDHRLALLLALRPNSTSWKGSTTDMRWRSKDGLTAAHIHISDEDDAVRIGVTITSPERDDTATLRPDRVEDAPILERLAELFPSPIGRILWNEEKDRFDNSVSIAILPGGRRLRIVRHAPKKSWHRTFRSTVYRGKGSFVRIEKTNGRNDCCYDDLKVAGYGMCWGDGELGPVEQNAAGPDLQERIERYAMHQDDENAILCVLSAIVDQDGLWEVREVAPRLAA